MPVVIAADRGAVLFHEAIGHSLEATHVAKNNSLFSGRKGQKIAHENVTLVDDATTQSDEQWDRFMGMCHATYVQIITDAYGSVASVGSSDNNDILPEDFFGDDDDFVAQDVFGDDGF